jgi:3-oxoacyl-[acyl-carrier protein] reductase
VSTPAARSLEGKVAIVTGAARGIGRAIARRFAAERAGVVVNDVNAAGAEDAAGAFTAAGGSAIAAAGDVAHAADVDALIETALRRFGRIDILVNNAGLTDTMRHVLEADDAWWHRVIAVNLTGAFLCSRRVARLMAEQGSAPLSICRAAARRGPTAAT